MSNQEGIGTKDNSNIEELARQAKLKLSKQAQDNNSEPVDMYASFREDADKPDSNQVNDELKTIPGENLSNPTLKNMPDFDYEEEKEKLLPYDEAIFPGGPTKTQIDSWKKQWDGYDIYAVEIMEQFFVFRTLNRFEYKQLVALQNIDPLQREEIICETVTLWPRKYKWDTMATEKAGIPSSFAQIIMDKSGFTKEYQIQVL